MTVQAPPILLEVQTSSVVQLATWPADASSYASFPFTWTVTLTITPQSTSYPISSVPYYYSGLDVSQGMWISNAVDGAAWLIQSIISQEQDQLICVLEDVNQYNTYADSSGNGDGSPPNSTSGFLFALNADNVPILTGIQDNILTSQWPTDILGRFSYLFPISNNINSSGSLNATVIGDITPEAGTFTDFTVSGNTTVPTVSLSDNSNSVASTAWIQGQNYAVLASPIFSGSPQSPTPEDGDSSQNIATTEFVQDSLFESLQSPTFSGNPQAPTPITGDNSESIATTAFVYAAMSPNSILTTYTTSGSINVTDNYSIINATTAVEMTLDSGTVNLFSIFIKNYGTDSASITAVIDGTSQTVTLSAATPIKDSLQLIWVSSLSSYIAE